MISLTRKNDVFTLIMDAGENRWNTTFVRDIDKALDEVEASTGPAALVTRSTDKKFFSNGLDLEWRQDPAAHPEGGDADAFGAEFMALMGRFITLPVPTICAINGHAFGAGFMVALCHDIRIMREDRGFMCANEMAIGFRIPSAELALFRHKLSGSAFYETVQFSRRWGGPDALAAGVVQHVASMEVIPELAQQIAEQSAPLAANRELFGDQKQRLFGENSVLNLPHGAAHMLKNADQFG